jgi:hypothetical protein
MARARLDVLRQAGGMIVPLLGQAADQRSRMFRTLGRIPFERSEASGERMVVRMAEHAQPKPELCFLGF